MIYKLPTRSTRKYRGKYQGRIHNCGGRAACFHIETNNGERYVADAASIRDLNRTDHIGRHIVAVLDFTRGHQYMSLADYAGILLVIRLIRCLRYGWDFSPQPPSGAATGHYRKGLRS